MSWARWGTAVDRTCSAGQKVVVPARFGGTRAADGSSEVHGSITQAATDLLCSAAQQAKALVTFGKTRAAHGSELRAKQGIAASVGWEGSLTIIDYRKKGTLIRTSQIWRT